MPAAARLPFLLFAALFGALDGAAAVRPRADAHAGGARTRRREAPPGENRIAGRVLDEEGRGIAGARVEAILYSSHEMSRGEADVAIDLVPP